jgi:hypothetical protein
VQIGKGVAGMKTITAWIIVKPGTEIPSAKENSYGFYSCSAEAENQCDFEFEEIIRAKVTIERIGKKK